MREIKFRAWDKISEEFISDTKNIELRNFTNPDSLVPIGDGIFREAKNIVFEQFTGLTDKNGVEIYEGDILFVDESRGAVRSGLSWYVEFNFDQDLNDIANSYDGRYEVCGNIHE